MAYVSGNGGLDQWRRHAGHMRPRRADWQRMCLKNRHHQGPRRQTQALVTHAAQLAKVIVAIGCLDRHIVQLKLGVGFRQEVCHGLMAAMQSKRFGVLSRAGGGLYGKLGRTAFRDGHPCTRPQPKGH